VGEARGLTNLRLIWLGTLAFLPLYAGVGVLLGRTWPPRDPAVLEWLVPALVGLGCPPGSVPRRRSCADSFCGWRVASSRASGPSPS